MAKSCLAAHNPGMITLSDEKTQEDDTDVMGWKSACHGAKTHFLMHNKAFILLAVTRKVFVREGASWELKSTENPVFSFCHWVVW